MFRTVDGIDRVLLCRTIFSDRDEIVQALWAWRRHSGCRQEMCREMAANQKNANLTRNFARGLLS